MVAEVWFWLSSYARNVLADVYKFGWNGYELWIVDCVRIGEERETGAFCEVEVERCRPGR